MTERRVFSATAMRCPTHGITNRATMREGTPALYCEKCGKELTGTASKVWRQRTFCLDEYVTGVTGWDCGDNWNGWKCPLFEKADAMSVMEQSNLTMPADEGYRAEYVEAEDTFIFWDCNSTPPDRETASEVATGFLHKPTGKHLYAIGGYNWTWSYDDEKED